jgi:hypothetical protein
MNIYKPNIYKPNIYKPNINRQARKVGLFCNARDEKNIKEWAAHHLLIGFDIIIIFDHKSKVPLSEVFSNFDKRLIIIRTELDGNIKVKLMNKAINISKNFGMDWFIYLDADEFLIINEKFSDVKHLLNIYSYADSLGVNWLLFGSNNLVEDPSGLILESYTKSSLMLDRHVKSFVRPHELKFSENPHFYHIKNPSKSLGIMFNILTYPQCFSKINIPYYKAQAYIAHYIYQSEETYKKRKVDFKIADDGTTRIDIGKEIHNNYNDVVNLQPQKYVNQIKQFLSYYDNTI